MRLFIALLLLGPSDLAYGAAASKVELIPWDTDESIERLSRTKHKVDFFPLANHFTSQDNKIICGFATSSIVLNALRLRKQDGLPVDKTSIKENEMRFLPEGFDPFFQKYTQDNVLNEKTKSKIEVLGKPIMINGELKKDYGLQLRQLARLIESHGAKVDLRIVNKGLSNSRIEAEIIENLSNNNDYVVVNYKRKALGQKGGGHISPLGAYDPKSGSFLIMDVNTNKAPWVWVKSADLINAMRKSMRSSG